MHPEVATMAKLRRTTATLCILFLLFLSLALFCGPAEADMSPWSQVNQNGFHDANNSRVVSTAEYKGCLYAGDLNTVTGCELWRFDGVAWAQVNTDGFGSANNWEISELLVHDDFLYAAVFSNINKCSLWRTRAVGGPPYTDWTLVSAYGFGDVNNNSITSMANYGAYIFVGTSNGITGGEVWRTAGVGGPPFTDWVKVNSDGFGAAANQSASYMSVFGSRLFIGTSNPNGCEIWMTSGVGGPPFTDWSKVNANGFGVATNFASTSMVVKGSYLYVGTDTGWAGLGSVWRTSGSGGPPFTDWTKVCADGFGDPVNVGVESVVSDGSYIYASTFNPATGTELWRSACSGGPPFTDWQQVNNDGFGAAATQEASALIFFNSNLFCGSDGTGGCKVWISVTVSPTWYLAEGSTAWGFDCYITVENPNDQAVNVKVTYMTGGGPLDGGTFNMPAGSQLTVNPKQVVPNTDFSTRVSCIEGLNIAVDRTMIWTGPGAASPEAHNSVGVTSPSTNWYLSEGSSSWGFESWLLIQNPNAAEATCKVTYMIEGAPPQTFVKKVPANSRSTYNMESDIGQRDASMFVESNLPVIPERAMYRNNRREGHDSIGTTTPATDYYLAEGTTAWGFTTWVLVQNPNPTPTEVIVTYMTDAGPQPQAAFTMPANSRKTIKVNDQVPNRDLSTRVHGSQPIIAERAMYWNNGTGEACHDSIGMSSPHTYFMLPDGQTSDGRETWTLVQNPNDEAVTILVTYFTTSGQGITMFNDAIPANSRRTYSMADKMKNTRAAVAVTCTTLGKKIMVERAMYWNNRGAGTDTIGGYLD
jgi:hypothetical protein